ncbi:hypothetical protein C0Q70_21576 [Pomacea canaliculata]|uniref:Uncharacterized protein n=1 Tax=Pomacea canaliculata TaxID=400727 RepID=A0A2T7NCY0_POMCA|nr:hypothetical protein C0Q70_21576 [Pomacea canaliculata]
MDDVGRTWNPRRTCGACRPLEGNDVVTHVRHPPAQTASARPGGWRENIKGTVKDWGKTEVRYTGVEPPSLSVRLSASPMTVT